MYVNIETYVFVGWMCIYENGGLRPAGSSHWRKYKKVTI